MEDKKLQKLNIIKVAYTDKKKDGQLLIDKYDKPYFRVGIQCNEYGQQWLNGFLRFKPDDWQGKLKEVEVWKEEYQGKEQLKFGLPKRDMWAEIKELKNRVHILEELTLGQKDEGQPQIEGKNIEF